MLKHLIPILIVLTTTPCLAQEPFPRIDSTELPGSRISSARIFNGQALFGYMDGGAELYLEYGFKGASITDLNIGNINYKVEIFKMKGPEEAFGIFSVSRFNCRSTPDISGFTCQTKYQLQVCRGPFYISIIGRKGNRTDSLNMLKIGKICIAKINGPDFDLTHFFPESSASVQQVKCFLAKGRLGIVNGAPDLEDYFSGITGYTAVIMNRDGQRTISIKFDTTESLNGFAILHKWDPGQIGSEPKPEPDGALVRILAKSHLYIEIRD